MSLRLSRLCRLIVCIILVVSLFCFSCIPSHAIGEVVMSADAMLNLAGIFLAMHNMGFTFSGLDISANDAYLEIYDSLTPQLQAWLNVAQFKLSPVSGYLSIAGKAWPKVIEIAQFWKDQLSPSDDTFHWLSPSGSSLVSSDGTAYEIMIVPGVSSSLTNQPVIDTSAYQFSSSNASFFFGDPDGDYIKSLTGGVSFRYFNGSSYATSTWSPSKFYLAYFPDVNKWGYVDYSYFNKRWNFSYYPVASIALTYSSTSDASLSVDGSDAIIPEGQIDDNKDVYVGSSGLDLGSVPDAISNIFDRLFGQQADPPDVNISQDINDLTNVNLDILSNVRNATTFLEAISEGVGSLVLDLVGFLGELPTFIGNLSGKFLSIWHYVIDWVNSMRPFLGSMFSVWQGLPYAMVVPVYASIVIVVVLGMYKKFFM